MADIIEFPKIQETYGTIVRLDDSIRGYVHALEHTDLSNALKVEQQIKPIYERLISLSQLAQAGPIIRRGCVTTFKYEHERQERLKALGNVIMMSGLETHVEEDPHDQPPAKRAA